jgi:RNA polymerase sigma-70 factor (ECF subfamily)
MALNHGLFDELASQHYDATYAYALKLTKQPDEARDLAQETFERALRSFEQFERGTNFRSWVFTILYRCFLDGLKKRKKIVRSDHLHLLPAEPVPREPAWVHVTGGELESAIAALPENMKNVYILHRQQLSADEISARLKINRSNVYVILCRAKKTLRDALAEKLPRE